MASQKAHALLDHLVIEYKLKTDSKLAEEVGIEASIISKVRRENRPVNDRLRVAVMRRFGMTLEQLDKLAPPAANA